jgi:hypothetical protein
MFILLAFALFQTVLPALSDATQVVVSDPQVVADIDGGKLKGDLAQLAWSPDTSEIYIQTVERTRGGEVKSLHHYIVSRRAKDVRGLDVEPAWASKYWSWKSGQASPAVATFKIAPEIREELVRSTASPTGGAMAKGGGADPLAGSTVEDVANAANQTQKKTVYTLRLKGELIGEWMNEAMTPGINWSWAPAPHRLIAFARREGGPIVLLDEAGKKQLLDVAKFAVLPAWSDSGTELAWLERKDKRKYVLMIAGVAAK